MDGAKRREFVDAAKAQRARRRALIVVAIVIAAVLVAWFLESTKPRRIVMASGPLDGLHHELALRYQAILARNGVTVVERVTTGADENARLLREPQSGVDDVGVDRLDARKSNDAANAADRRAVVGRRLERGVGVGPVPCFPCIVGSSATSTAAAGVVLRGPAT